MTITSFNIDKQIYRRKYSWLLSLLIIVVIGVMVQDYLRTLINDTNYYWSESLLFTSFWLLFLPGVLLLDKCLHAEFFQRSQMYVRVVISLLIVIVLHLLFAPLAIWSLSASLFDHTYGYGGILKYLIADYLYLVLGVYGTSALAILHSMNRMVPENNSGATAARIDKLLVGQGKAGVIIEASSIYFISASTPYIAIHLENRKLLHQETMKSIEKLLDDALFVRVHRSYIVNISKVTNCRSRLNGDYDLELQNGEIVRLSRNFWPAFRDRFKKAPQLTP